MICSLHTLEPLGSTAFITSWQQISNLSLEKWNFFLSHSFQSLLSLTRGTWRFEEELSGWNEGNAKYCKQTENAAEVSPSWTETGQDCSEDYGGIWWQCNYGLKLPKISHICLINQRIFVSISIIILVVHWELTLCFPALEAAARMQKHSTAKRGQIDVLQSKIKFLEEAMANAAKVTRASFRSISLHLERFVSGEMHGQKHSQSMKDQNQFYLVSMEISLLHRDRS